MKEKYSKPVTDVEDFQIIDVITTSVNDIGKDDNVVDGNDGWD